MVKYCKYIRVIVHSQVNIEKIKLKFFYYDATSEG